MYEYKAKYISNYDGDTLIMDVDLGFGITHRINTRLKGLDAPEIRGPDSLRAIKSKEFVINFFTQNADTYVRTWKDAKEKYGRYLVEVFALDRKDPDKALSLNKLLIQEGHAKAYDGGKRA